MPVQDEIDVGEAAMVTPAATGGARQPAPVARRPWPKALPEQMRGVAGVLSANAGPDLGAIEAAFTGRGPWKRRIQAILEALSAIGRAREVDGSWTAG